MRLNGVYLGLGENDVSDEIIKIKALLKKKFTPARKTLDDGPVFTPALTAEVIRVQDIFTKEGKEGAPRYLHGIINVEFKYDINLIKRPPKILPIVFTVEGHMSDMFIGPCASTASWLEQHGICHWKPVSYNSNKLPFDNKSGVVALEAMYNSDFIEGPPIDVNNPDGPKIMWPFPLGTNNGIVSFSQGGMVASDFMMQKMLPASPDSKMGRRLKDFKRGLAFGNPRREKNAVCAWALNPPRPDTQGIMDKRFDASKTIVADRWAEHPNKGDLFAENNEDDDGKDKTAIAKIITENSWMGGEAAIFARVMKLFGNPVGQGFSALKASYEAVSFLAKNPNPHYATIAEAGDIEWMRGVAA